VAICARDPETLERAQADLEGRRIVVLALAADVSEPTTAAALAQRVVAQFGGLDVLVNNAGVITVDPLATAALPFLRASEEGRVVNVVSVGRKIAFSEGLAAETRAAGVRVTTVYSGLMRTGSPRHTPVKGRHRRAARRIVDAVVRGERTAVLTLPARLAVAAHAALPGTTIRLLALVNRQG
jgi:short-subunit dehydrogenase